MRRILRVRTGRHQRTTPRSGRALLTFARRITRPKCRSRSKVSFSAGTDTLLHIHGTCIGTGLVMCYTDGGAQTALSLDGDAQIIRTAPASNDPVCKDSGASTVAYATGLDMKSHTAVLRVAASAEHETRFMGGLVSSSGGHSSWAHAAFRSRWPSTPQGMCTTSQLRTHY